MNQSLSLDSILQPVASSMEQFQEIFRQMVESNISLIAEINQYILEQNGKFLRPALVILSAGATGKITYETLNSAAIMEVLHTATLLHDDVVDRAKLRRGNDSVNHAWNNKIAVLMGDFLLTRVLKSINRLKNPKVMDLLTDSTEMLIAGEISQFDVQNGRADEDGYIEIIKNKTASLIAASCKLGVISIEGESLKADKLYRFGLNLGLAFQIKDDLLDLTEHKDVTGKDAASDLEQMIYTLPVIHTINQLSESEVIEFQKTVEKGSDNFDSIFRMIQEHGGIEYTEDKIRHYSQLAKDELQGLPKSEYRGKLLQLVDFNIQRKH